MMNDIEKEFYNRAVTNYLNTKKKLDTLEIKIKNVIGLCNTMADSQADTKKLLTTIKKYLT